MARFVVPSEFLLIANTSNKKARCFLDAIKRLVNTQSFFYNQSSKSNRYKFLSISKNKILPNNIIKFQLYKFLSA